jgi:C-terminal peptidase prc
MTIRLATESRTAVGTLLASLAQDVRFALRSFRLNLLFTVAAVVTLVSPGLTDVGHGRAPLDLPQSQAAPAAAPFKDSDPVPDQVRQETFRLVWETVRDKYFDATLGGVDWNAVRTRYEPEVRKAATIKDLHDVLNRMVHELPATHLNVLGFGFTQTVEPDAMHPDYLLLRAGDEGILVFSVPEDSPVWRAGIRPGYRVLGIGDVTMPDAAAIHSAPARLLSQATRLLTGPLSSEVPVRVLDEKNRERTVTLARTVPLKKRNYGRAEVRSSRVRPRVAYLWFDAWGIDLPAKLEPVLAGLGDTDGLILDLRQNRGGMNPGVDRLAKFLMADAGLLAMTTPRGEERREWRHEGSGEAAYRGKVAIIIDEASGSASEVFAAAIQEKGRAVVVGHRSYGGVLNSTQLPLPTGGVLQYPHSDMTTPKGGRIEGRGVVPDIAVDLKRADLLAGRDTVLERAIEAIQPAKR